MKIKNFLILSITLLISCNLKQNKTELRVATAANLRFAMEQVNSSFEKQFGIKVEMITASSGKLTAQIKNGAPYDIFLSANFKYPNTLYHEKLTQQKPVLFCKGVIIVWTNKDITLDSSLIFLKNPEIEKIAIANPKNAPYGIASEELLRNLNLYDEIKSKLIFAENVSQLNQYVINRATDVGLTSKSAVFIPKLKNTGKWKEIDTSLYTTVKQYVVELKRNDNPSPNTKKYIDFLFSEKAKKILKSYGYLTD